MNGLRAFEAYGLSILSDWPLPSGTELPCHSGPAQLTVRRSSDLLTQQFGLIDCSQPNNWFHRVLLADGRLYLRWSRFFEFLVSLEGNEIVGRSLSSEAELAFQHFLLARILAFAMVRQGIEPLHGTANLLGDHAVCFLGDCEFGKSTLAAAFVRAGFPLLTDDLIRLDERGGYFHVYAGPSRIKLFPEIAANLLPLGSTGTPINHLAEKRAFPVPSSKIPNSGVPVRAIYVLGNPETETGDHIAITELTRASAFLEVIKNTLNIVTDEVPRLTQLFHFAQRVASGIPMKFLTYPRRLELLPEVIAAVRADLSR